MSTPTDALPEPWNRCYEWKTSPFGVHLSFSSNAWNGSRPDRTIELFTTDQLRAALAAQAEKHAAEVSALRRSNAAAKTVIAGMDYRAQLIGAEFGKVTQRAADIEGERAANAILTDELEQLTAERDAALNLWPRDCRLCANYTTQTGGCVSVVQCVDSMQFRATAPRQYWIAGPS